MPRLEDGPSEGDKSHGSGSVKIAVDPMGNDQQLRFRWDGHINHIAQILSQQRMNNESKYCDCTLVSEDGYVLRAHQAILSAASGYFQKVLKEVAKDQHPTIVLRGANFREMSCILDYMYKGQTQVSLRLMGAVMEVASMLAVKGLSQKQSNASIQKYKDNKTYTLEAIKDNEESSTRSDGGSGTPRKSGGGLAALAKEGRLSASSSDSDSSSSSSDDSDSDSSSSAEGSDNSPPAVITSTSPKAQHQSSPKHKHSGSSPNRKKRKRKHHEKSGDGKGNSSDSDEGAARTKMRPPQPKTDKQIMDGISQAIENAINLPELKTEFKTENTETPNTPVASPVVGRQRRAWGSKTPKDPNKPKRAQSAFFYFANEDRSKIRGEHPEMSVGEISKELGRMWNEKTPEAKAPYEKSALGDRARYDEAMKKYKAETPTPTKVSPSVTAASNTSVNQGAKEDSDDAASSDGGDGSKKESKKKLLEEEGSSSAKKKKSISVPVLDCNKNVDVPTGWVRTVTMRSGGASAGKFDVYYHSPYGKKLRSRVEVEKHCEERAIEIELSKFQFTHRFSESDSSDIKTPVKSDPVANITSEHPEGTETMIKCEDGGSARVFVPPAPDFTPSSDSSSDSSDDDDDDDDDDKKDASVVSADEGESKKFKPEVANPLKGFTKDEIRRFIKSFKKFSNPLRRLDRLAIDADLLDKPRPSLHSLGQTIISRCQEAMDDWEEKKKDKEEAEAATKGEDAENADATPKKKQDRGPSMKISGVALNAKALLQSLRELEPLDRVIPHVAEERNYWLLSACNINKTRDPNWGIPWDIVDDSRLLRGIYEYGLGSWEIIKDDPSLKLSGKILKDEESSKPQAKHLDNRMQYLLKILVKKEEQGPEEVIEKPKKTPVKLKKAKEIKQEVEDDPDKPPTSMEFVVDGPESSEDDSRDSKKHKSKDKHKDRDGHKMSKKDKEREKERDRKEKKRQRKEKERDERRISKNDKHVNRHLPDYKQPKFASYHKMDSFKIPKASDEIQRAPATFIEKSKMREKYGGSSDIARLGGALNSLVKEKAVEVDLSKFSKLGKAHLYLKKDKPTTPETEKPPVVTSTPSSVDKNKLQEKTNEEKKLSDKPKKSLEEYKKMLSHKSSSPIPSDKKSTPIPNSANGSDKLVGNNSHSVMKNNTSHDSSKQNFSNGPQKPSDINSKSSENKHSSDKNAIGNQISKKSTSPDRSSKSADRSNRHSQEKNDNTIRDKYRSPDRKYPSHSPKSQDRHYKSDRNHHSPHKRPRSPERGHRSPDRRRSPNNRYKSPNRYNRSPDRYPRSPDRYPRSPDQYHRSQERQYRSSPDRHPRSPDRYRRSPDRYRNSQDRHRRTPERKHRSPRSPDRPPSPDSNRRPKSPKPQSPKQPAESNSQNPAIRSRPPSPKSAGPEAKNKDQNRDESMLSDIDSDDSLGGIALKQPSQASDSESDASDHEGKKSDDEKMEDSDHENDQQRNSDDENIASDDNSDDESENEQRNSDHSDNEQGNNENDHSDEDDDENNEADYANKENNYERQTNSEQKYKEIDYNDVKIEHESEAEEMDTSQDFGHTEETMQLQGMTVPMEEFNNQD